MKLRPWSRSACVLFFLGLLPRAASAVGPPDGGLIGVVEDTRGAPVAGAIISLFGKGVGGSGLVALSDSAGRFFLPAVPAGSYTLRALGAGHLPAPARRVTVLPNHEATFTVSLIPVGEEKAAALAAARAQEEKDDPPSLAELRWLLRHKRRSVLEARGPEVETADATAAAAPAPARLLASLVPDLAGTVEVMASPVESDGEGLEPSTSYSLLRLKGRISNAGQWSLGGVVAESESTTWRMAAEFAFEPGGGHKLQVGTGYGTRVLRPLASGDRLGRGDNHSVGAAFLQDQWQMAEKVTTTLGGRFSYIGFLRSTNHFDPLASVELRHDDHTRVSATVETRTLAPGGDLLTLSTLAAAPAVAFAFIDDSLRPERSARFEVAVDQSFGPTTLRAQTFYEDVHHQLANAYAGPRAARTLHISDAGGTSARGMGLSVSRRFGGAVNGSLSYRFGHSWREAALPTSSAPAAPLGASEGDFHDVATRLETSIDGTGTRVVAFYRVIHLSLDPERMQRAAVTNHRFDVQLSQGLPFVGRLTRADWDFLLSIRNLFYETSEGAVLDELAVTNPPTRVLGGISVRF